MCVQKCYFCMWALFEIIKPWKNMFMRVASRFLPTIAGLTLRDL
jgi:hypothetical protein